MTPGSKPQTCGVDSIQTLMEMMDPGTRPVKNFIGPFFMNADIALSVWTNIKRDYRSRA